MLILLYKCEAHSDLPKLQISKRTSQQHSINVTLSQHHILPLTQQMLCKHHTSIYWHHKHSHTNIYVNALFKSPHKLTAGHALTNRISGQLLFNQFQYPFEGLWLPQCLNVLHTIVPSNMGRQIYNVWLKILQLLHLINLLSIYTTLQSYHGKQN